jgi:hypothetical protein
MGHGRVFYRNVHSPDSDTGAAPAQRPYLPPDFPRGGASGKAAGLDAGKRLEDIENIFFKKGGTAPQLFKALFGYGTPA